MNQRALRTPLTARLSLWLWRQGSWPLLLLALLLATAMLWWGRVLPLQQQIAALDAARMAPVSAFVAPVVDPQSAADRARLQAFRQALPAYREHPAQLRRLVKQTRQALQWTQAEFSQDIDTGLDLSRLRITVPVSGTYPALQAAIERALLQSPNLSLDQIQFRREASDRQQLEARIRLSLWLRAPSRDTEAR